MRASHRKDVPPARPRSSVSSPVLVVGAIVLFGLGTSAGIAWFTADTGGERSRPEQLARGEGRVSAPLAPLREAARPAAAGALPANAVAPPPADSVSRATEEATVQLEAYRDAIVSRCWPAGAQDAKPVKVTLNVTFDPSGREIARGVSDDRRARSGAFGNCLRKVSGTALSISPPGRTVAVSIPVSYP